MAAAAQVTKPIVYRHCGSKKGLYLALLTKHDDDLPSFFEGVEDIVEPEVMRAILERWLDYVRENQHAWLMQFRNRSVLVDVAARVSEPALRGTGLSRLA